ncbi:hypothetical protein HMPREF1862_00526 [Varibaculum cambriense]|uniref:Uncharacterized protein n=1 Tax=Varibaculum cambriense TaxID=184870 RepID=A0AB34X0X7_9ACTO|nr:hypothetical protein HMPREF1862_00526 [Varibaculum cambriense]
MSVSFFLKAPPRFLALTARKVLHTGLKNLFLKTIKARKVRT